ncbi:hypothetical protein TIFTF001_034654 [Ficus carica]|uniref:Uncharacterized protein n=1 Tax=Ficus carica TaxID=3494 RepID=A0AA88JAU6_FICCA|nr:hypothetical protein TIFTF001_034654 [Ficus carica]
MFTDIESHGENNFLSHKIKQVNVVVTYRLATRAGLNVAAPITPWLHATVSNLPAISNVLLWKAGAADCEMWDGHRHGKSFMYYGNKLPCVVPIRIRSVCTVTTRRGKSGRYNCNAGKLNVADDAHRSNEKSIAASIGGHSIVNNIGSQYDKVSSSDSVSDGVVVADYTPITLRIDYNEGCSWQLRATRMKGSELFVVKRFDDVHTCSIEIVQGHHRQAKSWMIGECVKAKYLDLTNTLYRPSEITRDMQAEFGVSFNYLRAWRGKEAALTSLRGDDAESYKANIVYPDAAFGICVQHLAANLKTSEYHRHMESIRGRNADMHRYLVEDDPTKWSRAYFNGRRYAIMTTNIAESFNNVDRQARLMPVGFLVKWLRGLLQRWFVDKREEALKITSKLAPTVEKLIRTNFSLGLTVTPRPADQFEYAVTNNAAQIWIVDMSEMTFHPIGSAEGWDVSEKVRLQIVNPPTTKRGPRRPRVRRIPSQGEEHEPNRCGRCNGYGHNRQTYTNSVPLRKRPTTRPDT